MPTTVPSAANPLQADATTTAAGQHQQTATTPPAPLPRLSKSGAASPTDNAGSGSASPLTPGHTKGLAGFWSAQNDEVKGARKKRLEAVEAPPPASTPECIENVPRSPDSGVVRAEDPGEWQKPVAVEHGHIRNVASSFQQQDAGAAGDPVPVVRRTQIRSTTSDRLSSTSHESRKSTSAVPPESLVLNRSSATVVLAENQPIELSPDVVRSSGGSSWDDVAELEAGRTRNLLQHWRAAEEDAAIPKTSTTRYQGGAKPLWILEIEAAKATSPGAIGEAESWSSTSPSAHLSRANEFPDLDEHQEDELEKQEDILNTAAAASQLQSPSPPPPPGELDGSGVEDVDNVEAIGGEVESVRESRPGDVELQSSDLSLSAGPLHITESEGEPDQIRPTVEVLQASAAEDLSTHSLEQQDLEVKEPILQMPPSPPAAEHADDFVENATMSDVVGDVVESEAAGDEAAETGLASPVASAKSVPADTVPNDGAVPDDERCLSTDQAAIPSEAATAAGNISPTKVFSDGTLSDEVPRSISTDNDQRQSESLPGSPQKTQPTPVVEVHPRELQVRGDVGDSSVSVDNPPRSSESCEKAKESAALPEPVASPVAGSGELTAEATAASAVPSAEHGRGKKQRHKDGKQKAAAADQGGQAEHHHHHRRWCSIL